MFSDLWSFAVGCGCRDGGKQGIPIHRLLEVGGSAMQRTIMVPVQIVLIMEALILIFILLADIIKRRQK